MSAHRYPVSSLLSDGVRAAFGIVTTVGPLLFLDLALPLALVFGALGAVFLIFALRLMEQALSSIELSCEGIARRGPVKRKIAWSDVTSLKLAHFAAPRRPWDGWYQLTLSGGSSVLKVESTINGFDDIVAAAVEAAKICKLDFDPATRENLKEFGNGRSAHSAIG